MVSRGTIGNTFLNKAKILDADIDNLNVKNLVVENDIETENKDFDVIIVGGGPAAIAATLNLVDKLSGTDKKIALFTDANKRSDIDFYSSFVNNPNNLPEGTPEKEELIKKYFDRGVSGLLGALGGGYSVFNLATHDLKQDNIYNMKCTIFTNNDDGVPLNGGPFRGGGMPYSKNIGGLVNMNGGVAITDPKYYHFKENDIYDSVPIDLRHELDYVKSIYETTTMYPNLDTKGYMPNSISAANIKNFATKLNNAMNSSVFGKSGVTPTDILIEPEYYWSCGKINFQRKLNNAQSLNPNLHIFYNSFVDNLEINNVNGEQVCTGIYTNSKLFTAEKVILSANHPGTIALLQTVNSTIERPLKNLGKNWNETQSLIFPLQIANFNPNLAHTKEYNYSSSVIYGNISNGDPYRGIGEVYSGSTFNLEYDPHLLKYTGFLTGTEFKSVKELMRGSPAMPSVALMTVQAILFLQGQEFVYDPTWPLLGGDVGNAVLETLTIEIPYLTPNNPNGTYWDIIKNNFGPNTPNKPVGFLNFTVFIAYSGTKYNNYLNASNNVIKYNTEGTVLKCNPKSKFINNPLGGSGKDSNYITYDNLQNTLKYDISVKYFDFKEGTPQDKKDDMINDMRRIIDKIFYEKNNLRENLFKQLSLGKWDLTAGTLNNLRGWTEQDFASNPPTFEDQTQYTKTMKNEEFLTIARRNSFPTWHWTQGTSDYIDVNTFEFNDIKGLYSGDQLAFPNPYATSTTLLSSSCAVRASNSVVSKLVN